MAPGRGQEFRGPLDYLLWRNTRFLNKTRDAVETVQLLDSLLQAMRLQLQGLLGPFAVGDFPFQSPVAIQQFGCEEFVAGGTRNNAPEVGGEQAGDEQAAGQRAPRRPCLPGRAEPRCRRAPTGRGPRSMGCPPPSRC